MTTALTGRSTLGDWLADPAGGPLIRELLTRLGQDVSQLGPARVFSLNRLVGLSEGRISQPLVDGLVRAVNDGRLVTGDEPTTTGGSEDPEPVRQGLTLDRIQIRDPFVLHDRRTATYHLYGSTDPNIWDGPGIGFDTYRSTDLLHWEGPFAAFRPPAGFWSEGSFWAPEVHAYQDRWYMFATFTAPDGYRGTQILVGDTPQGPFSPWSEGAVTPRKWQCLDGTLHLDESGAPWIVYCHEWTQIHDGAIHAQRLSADLRHTTGTPVFLFNASDAPWARPLPGVSRRFPAHVTDGPFLFRLRSGHLLMLWSSHGDQGYAMGLAHSASGRITGPWTQDEQALWPTDGGHGMVFRLGDGSLALTLHQPNNTPDERAVVRRLVEHDTTVTIEDTATPDGGCSS
ncbi:glycoside hydrolase family 43 protein [Streptomyces sp. NPDC091280]|uniref:glycoside hydrolase family 43 protein n=1 Tax=Streptomyces sp. NPDC091280 TaxID=3365984 RepID=UPI0037FEB6BA